MQNKFDNLKEYLKQTGKQGICLAFSGGIDSLLLLFLCKKVNANFIAVTFKSDFQTGEEIKLTEQLARKYNVKHIIIDTNPLDNKILLENPKDRCYHCKKLMFSKAAEFAKSKNLQYIMDGTNFDDLHQYRPGLKALSELNIVSPFAKFEVTKKEIRAFAKENDIEIFDKPSTPCLATRLPYGDKVTKEKLEIIENGEKFLRENSFECCRVRLHADIARIEIPPEKFEQFLLKKEEITKYFKILGIKYITLDIEGFRSGSMD